MYPDISYLLKDLFGITGYPIFSQIKTYGFFLSLAILFSYFALLFEVKRRERVGLILPIKRKRSNYLVSDKIGFVVFIVLLGVIFGSKLLDVIENHEKVSITNIFHLLFQAGWVYYGGLIFGFLGGFIGCYFLRLPFKNLLDSISPYLMLGYGIGRLGCHLSGDGDWGIPNTQSIPIWWVFPNQFWAYDYPHNSNEAGFLIENCQGRFCHHLNPPVYPTSLYEASFAFILSFVLLSLSKKFERESGIVFMFFILFMSIERFLIEFIRVNPKYCIRDLCLSQAQYISILIALISILRLALFFNNKKLVTLS